MTSDIPQYFDPQTFYYITSLFIILLRYFKKLKSFAICDVITTLYNRLVKFPPGILLRLENTPWKTNRLVPAGIVCQYLWTSNGIAE